MSKVNKSFVSRGCVNPVTGTGCTSVDIGVSAYLELVDHTVPTDLEKLENSWNFVNLENS